jgi:hypothetical protein
VKSGLLGCPGLHDLSSALAHSTPSSSLSLLEPLGGRTPSDSTREPLPGFPRVYFAPPRYPNGEQVALTPCMRSDTLPPTTSSYHPIAPAVSEGASHDDAPVSTDSISRLSARST